MRRSALWLATALICLSVALPATAGDLGTNINPTVSLKGGWWDADVSGFDGGPAYGGEFAIDNLGVAPEFGKLHHMFSLNHVDDDGLRLNSAEWNLHWMAEVRPNTWIGLGPGVGWLWTDGKNLEDSPALQFGASTHTYVGQAVFGLETRYQWTEAGSADNWLTMLTVGYRF